MRNFLVAASLLLLAGCSTVRNVSVRPDYEREDRTRTLRLAVITSPLPAGLAVVGEMWSEIARRYVNDKRDFIASVQRASEQWPGDACAEGLEGVLHLDPAVRRDGGKVRVELQARLVRCRDQELVWSAEGAGAWPSDDAQLSETTAVYVARFGEEVQPYVAPAFRILRAVLATLPFPKIEDDDAVMEKIELTD